MARLADASARAQTVAPGNNQLRANPGDVCNRASLAPTASVSGESGQADPRQASAFEHAFAQLVGQRQYDSLLQQRIECLVREGQLLVLARDPFVLKLLQSRFRASLRDAALTVGLAPPVTQLASVTPAATPPSCTPSAAPLPMVDVPALATTPPVPTTPQRVKLGSLAACLSSPVVELRPSPASAETSADRSRRREASRDQTAAPTAAGLLSPTPEALNELTAHSDAAHPGQTRGIALPALEATRLDAGHPAPQPIDPRGTTAAGVTSSPFPMLASLARVEEVSGPGGTSPVHPATSGQTAAIGASHRPGGLRERAVPEGLPGPAPTVASDRRGVEAPEPHPSASSTVASVLPRGTGVAIARRFNRLDDFVAGPHAAAALAATRAFTEPDAPRHSLYLFGGTGTGKTHLLEGIVSQLRRQPGGPQGLLLTAEQFTNMFTSALRSHELPSFRFKLRGVDVLLIDDVDFLDGKPRVQEEFLHTLQQLESTGRRLVLAADRHPRLLSRTRPELQTRFLSGVVCRVEQPDRGTREQIVVRKAGLLALRLTPESARLLAASACTSVRELEGLLHTLRNLHSTPGQPVPAPLVRQVVSELERDCVRVVRLPDIERVVCETFGVSVEDLRSARRTRTLAEPRMLAMFLARRHTRAAYAEIGQYFGGRNHATVISAEKRMQQALVENAPVQVAVSRWGVADLVQAIEQRLLAG